MASSLNALKAFAGSIRGRAAMLSMLVVAVALALGSYLLLEAYEQRLVENLDTTLEQQVADRVRLIDSGGPKSALTTVLQDESFVWIGTLDGAVTAQGGSIVPIDNPVPDEPGRTHTIDLLVEEQYPDGVEREEMSLRVASAVASETEQVVVAGSELSSVESAVSDLGGLFAIAVPIVTALVGWLAWMIASRALQPVAAIRHQAEEIGGRTLSERVPVPDSNDEIADLALTVNDMLARIEHHEKAIRQFSSDASHELKSPIANIRALVETRASEDPDWPRVQSQLTAETERLGALVGNLLFLANHRDGALNRNHSIVQLDELLFAEAELVSATTDLKVGLSDVEPIQVSGVGADIGRLVRNLVDNAARHAASRIDLSLTLDGDWVVMAVADDGPGIAQEDRQRIFDRFIRLDEARSRDAGGTGLGLSIVRQIAESHGATVEAAESTRGGAKFAVRWPAI